MDNTSVLGSTQEEMKQLCGKLLITTEKVRLFINDEKKTKYMTISYQDNELFNNFDFEFGCSYPYNILCK